jgi:hypothetical protein
MNQVSVAHIYNSSYLGRWDEEEHGLRSAWGNSSREPHLQMKLRKMDWWHGSSDRAPVLQVWISEFKPQSYQKKKKGRKKVVWLWFLKRYMNIWCAGDQVRALLMFASTFPLTCIPRHQKRFCFFFFFFLDYTTLIHFENVLCMIFT